MSAMVIVAVLVGDKATKVAVLTMEVAIAFVFPADAQAARNIVARVKNVII